MYKKKRSKFGVTDRFCNRRQERYRLPLRRNDNIRGAMDGASVEMSGNFEFCAEKLANSNCQDGNLNYSHPKVAGGLFVASKYRASTNGSSAILCTIVESRSFGHIANLAVITSSEITGRRTKLAWSALLAYGRSIVRC